LHLWVVLVTKNLIHLASIKFLFCAFKLHKVDSQSGLKRGTQAVTHDLTPVTTWPLRSFITLYCTVYMINHRHPALQWHSLSLITNKSIVRWMYFSSENSSDSCWLCNHAFFILKKITREMESDWDIDLAQTNYCYLLESRQIHAHFSLPLLQRISGNPLISLGNSLRSHRTILKYTFLDRADWKSQYRQRRYSWRKLFKRVKNSFTRGILEALIPETETGWKSLSLRVRCPRSSTVNGIGNIKL